MRLPCLLPVLAVFASCAAAPSPVPAGLLPLQDGEPPAQPAPAQAADPLPGRTVTFQLGGRSLSGDVWSDADDQVVFGMALELIDPEARRGPEFGLLLSDDSQDINNILVQGETTEFFAGYQFRFGDPRGFDPYLGFGLSAIESELAILGQKDDDASLGYYFHLGARHAITHNLYLGVDFRTLWGTDTRLHGVSGDSDYNELALALGLAF